MARKRRESLSKRFLRKVLRQEVDEGEESLAFLTHAPGSLSKEEEELLQRRRAAVREQRADGPRVEEPADPYLQAPTDADPPADDDPWPVHPRKGRPKPERSRRPQRSRRGSGGGITKRFAAGVGTGGRATVRMAKRALHGAGRVGETAGRDALDRTWSAFRLARRRRSSLPPPPKRTLLESSFLLQLPGAVLWLLTPGSLLSLVGATLLGALALGMIKLSLWTGGFAVLFAGVQLAALRIDHVREVSNERSGLSWPEWDGSFGALPIYVALACLFLPAALAGLSAWGPAAWDEQNPASIPARVDRLLRPGEAEQQVFKGALEAGEAYQQRVWSSEEMVRESRREAGVAPGETDAENRRKRAQAEQALETLRKLAGEDEAGLAATRERSGDAWGAARQAWADLVALLRRVLDPRAASGAHLLAIGCLAAALLLFPMALLAATQLKSAYAVFHLPLLLRSIVSAPLAYAVCVACFAAQDLLLLAALVVPHAAYSATCAPLVAYGASATTTTACWIVLTAISGGVLGRFYRTRRRSLAWDEG